MLRHNVIEAWGKMLNKGGVRRYQPSDDPELTPSVRRGERKYQPPMVPSLNIGWRRVSIVTFTLAMDLVPFRYGHSSNQMGLSRGQSDPWSNHLIFTGSLGLVRKGIPHRSPLFNIAQGEGRGAISPDSPARQQLAITNLPPPLAQSKSSRISFF